MVWYVDAIYSILMSDITHDSTVIQLLCGMCGLQNCRSLSVIADCMVLGVEWVRLLNNSLKSYNHKIM